MIETETLTKEQTKLYFQYLKEGKMEYREKIILGNYRLVIHVVKRYTNSGLEFDDLTSIGVIGLIKAIDHFDLDKNISFSTFAIRCINNEILMSLRHKKNWVSLSSTFPLSEVDQITLEEKLSDDFNLEETIVDTMFFEENIQFLKKVLPYIEPEKRKILLEYYGINGPPLNQMQLAQKYHVSRSFISKALINTIKEILGMEVFDEEVNSLQKLLTKNKKNNKIDM